MSLDASLKTGGGLKQHRNVLTRPERVERLAKLGKFDSQQGNPVGLPKVGNRKPKPAAKKKKTGEAEGDAAAAPVAGA